MTKRTFAIVVGLALTSVLAAEVGDSWARAGGGGSRGSRSYSAPARPSPSPAAPATPTSPSRSLSQPAPSPAPSPGRGLFGGLMGGLAGFALGGLLGGLLFGGLGHGMGGGIGLFDIVLIGGGLFLLWQFMKRRRETQEPAYATAGASATSQANTGAGGTAVLEMPSGDTGNHGDLDRGVGHIRQMDPGFDPVALADWARAQFGIVQTGITLRDVRMIQDRIAPQMYAELQKQCDHLKASRRTNQIEKVAVERAEVTEAWQESGQDFVTVLLAGSMIDYTVDDASGQLVEGSKDVQRFEEFWTFTRAVGPNAWKLTAIQAG